MEANQLTEEQRLSEIHVFVTRFLSYGWEWRVIAKVINYYFCTRYTTRELIRLYSQEDTPPQGRRGRHKINAANAERSVGQAPMVRT